MPKISFKSHLSIVYTEEYMKSRETVLKEMIPRNIVKASLSIRNIIQAHLSQILKISILTFK
jgi:hypothetical protein